MRSKGRKWRSWGRDTDGILHSSSAYYGRSIKALDVMDQQLDSEGIALTVNGAPKADVLPFGS